MGFIPADALQNLHKYAYKGVDKSPLSKYVLNPFWTWFVTLWPLWVAPNTITLSGLCLVLVNFATLLWYDPTYLAEKGGVVMPSWVYFSCAIGLFLYQSFDAIDGKQARRTGMAGPLGEMFDHGCDAMNTTLEVIMASQALNLGRSWWTVASQMATLANFYLTTWEEYHTGELYLGVFSGPVEGILMIVSIYTISGLYAAGPSFWDTGILTFLRLTNVPVINQLPDMPLNDSFMVFGAFGVAFNVQASYRNVRRARLAAGKPTVQPLMLLLPFVVSAGIQALWLVHPRYDDSAIINSPLFVPFLCAWGLQFAHQVGRMILAHVTSSPFPWWDWMWVWSLCGAVDANLPMLVGRAPIVQTNETNRAVVVYLTLAVSFVAYARFCTLVINEITNFMGIACFTVRKKDKDGKWQESLPSSGPNGKKE
ncbi:Choline ethanolaminephosphotransferase [Mycena sanguinolenta]|uniref:diacylglycerol cholinephosphotransferase n=1 Tax=Mycena sanguinolenta TaxID=230812 RepID=A0A8H6XI41_9AGAR|nr:Choline ethanolaminephosphotransferase [Mycena sanguinolenta]